MIRRYDYWRISITELLQNCYKTATLLNNYPCFSTRHLRKGKNVDHLTCTSDVRIWVPPIKLDRNISDTGRKHVGLANISDSFKSTLQHINK